MVFPASGASPGDQEHDQEQEQEELAGRNDPRREDGAKD
jgi:hypothetical protein